MSALPPAGGPRLTPGAGALTQGAPLIATQDPMARIYWEDFIPGSVEQYGPRTVSREEIIAFAAEFDPQPFHTDHASASRTIFSGLAASGWHTAAMTMRLMVDSDLEPAGGIVGAGFEAFRWPRPVRPGDELHINCEVLETRPSKSRPEQGLFKLRTTTFNQNNEAVQILVGSLIVPRRPKPE